jgi:hypothetical protein
MPLHTSPLTVSQYLVALLLQQLYAQPHACAGFGVVGPYFACLPRAPRAAPALPAGAPRLQVLSTLASAAHGCELQSSGLLVVGAHYVTVVLPLLLWGVGVSARWLRACRARRAAPFLRWLDAPQVLALAWMHVRVMMRIVPVMGWPTLALAPGLGWTLHVAAALLAGAYAAGLRLRR